MAALVFAVAIGARISTTIPGSPVPQSAQTLAIVLGAALLGARDASIGMLAYLALGAIGLPVFADGGAGASHLIGPTAGYLGGFVAAGWLVGRAADRGQFRSLPVGFAVALGGHAVILALGWGWLAGTAGPAGAFEAGVAPFVWGGIVKSAIAAASVFLVRR
ncbi:MAG: biotin transporter BioY [Gemmatimonadota bacterium]|nr:biotin transporter BioY [Gemmatimonadota bacterium]